MAGNKTQVTEASVEGYFAAITDVDRRKDCVAIAQLMSEVTRHPAVMWGTGIVGFGRYHYRYDSGREGDACLTGFSSRKSAISVYLTAAVLAQDELLARLGRHTMAKGCLYLRRLDDVDPEILKRLVAETVAERNHRHG